MSGIDSTRVPCPLCRTPDALVLFQVVVGCHSPACRYFSADLELSDNERERRIVAAWEAYRGRGVGWAAP